jgi:dTDP-4-dehydrorhamnose reductase
MSATSTAGGVAVILGGGGVLARELAPVLTRDGFTVHPVAKDACDITVPDQLRALFDAQAPTLVVNCAAYTLVDKAETERERAFAINGVGAGNVARAAAAAGAAVIHISSDYVFPGTQRTPYRETDPTGPAGLYAQSKLAGEHEVLAAGGRAYVVRTGELYGTGGRNFFHVILGRARKGQPLKVINDQIVSPTWTRELSEQLAVIATQAPPGLYHATADGEVSWFDAARAACEIIGVATEIAPCTTEEFAAPAPRPRYSVLGHEALGKLGLYRMRPWRQALTEWLKSGEV